MIPHLNESFDLHPREAHLIFIMLAGYGELEFELATFLGHILADTNTAFRTLYRLRSEAQRLDTADALLNPACAHVDLAGQYATTLGAMRWCKNIRNKYTHSHWSDHDGVLVYFDLESKAQSAHPIDIVVDFMPVDETLLTQQAEYFRYTGRCLTFLSDEYQLRSGNITSHDGLFPSQLKQPNQHSRPS